MHGMLKRSNRKQVTKKKEKEKKKKKNFQDPSIGFRSSSFFFCVISLPSTVNANPRSKHQNP